jgi:hypothetical protein
MFPFAARARLRYAARQAVNIGDKFEWGRRRNRGGGHAKGQPLVKCHRRPQPREPFLAILVSSSAFTRSIRIRKVAGEERDMGLADRHFRPG